MIVWLCTSHAFKSKDFKFFPSELYPTLTQIKCLRNHVSINEDYSGIRTLHESPKIFVVNDFLSDKECDEYLDIFTRLDASDKSIQASAAPKLQLDVKRLLLYLIPLLIVTSTLLTAVKDEFDATLNFRKFMLNFVTCSAIASCIIPSSLYLLEKVEETKYTIGDSRSQRSSWMIQLGGTCPHAINTTQAIVTKIENLLNATSSYFERPTLTRYRTGEQFKLHNDASIDIIRDGWDLLGGQRLATVIIYLNNVKNGGATFFDKLNLRVKPRKGSLLGSVRIMISSSPITFIFSNILQVCLYYSFPRRSLAKSII